MDEVIYEDLQTVTDAITSTQAQEMIDLLVRIEGHLHGINSFLHWDHYIGGLLIVTLVFYNWILKSFWV